MNLSVYLDNLNLFNMKIYYPHFHYNGEADDSYYYSGLDWKKYLHREDAVAEAERIMHAQWGDADLPPMADCIESYTIYSEEVY